MIYQRGERSRTEQSDVGESIVYVEGYLMVFANAGRHIIYVGGSTLYVGRLSSTLQRGR